MTQYFLPVYWLMCIAATHLPLPAGSEPLLVWDKGVHATMYAILAFLFGWRLLERGRAFRDAFLFGISVLAVYGLADELTQPYFGRTADVFDWVADLLGATVGFVAVMAVTARRRRRT